MGAKGGRGGSMGNKFRTTLGLCVGSVMNCADNTGAKNLYIISVKGIKGRLNKIPGATVGNMVMATVKKGKPELRKKVMPAVVVRQRKTWRRVDGGGFVYFEGACIAFWRYEIIRCLSLEMRRNAAPCDGRACTPSGLLGTLRDRRLHITKSCGQEGISREAFLSHETACNPPHFTFTKLSSHQSSACSPPHFSLLTSSLTWKGCETFLSLATQTIPSPQPNMGWGCVHASHASLKSLCF
mmetsp:Transcript_36143/g.84442  ORF Transcript_36143/g.84442 Transcript_36143/m.84442 type:complete len:240 (-) Transcript_36143:253-972(-)